MVRDLVSVVLNDILPCGHGGVLMLKFYLDRGARKDADGVMSIAGALFQPFFYDQFLHMWQPFLDDAVCARRASVCEDSAQGGDRS